LEAHARHSSSRTRARQCREFDTAYDRAGCETRRARRLHPSGGVDHPGDFLAQARNVFGAVKAHVEEAGGTLRDVMKITTYVTDIRYRMDFRTVRDEFFGQRGPASTFIEVGSLSHPDYMIELEAIAVI
jgi:2-iminobutanoate/2-iminopropanoate deaminase